MKEKIEGDEGDVIENTNSETAVEDIIEHKETPTREVAQTAHEEHESLKEKEKEYPKPVHEKQYQSDIVRDEETRQSHVPIKSSSFEDTVVKAKKYGRKSATTDYASTAQTTTQVPKHVPPAKPFDTGDPFSAMNADTERKRKEQSERGNINFGAMNSDTEKYKQTMDAKKQQISDYQRRQEEQESSRTAAKEAAKIQHAKDVEKEEYFFKKGQRGTMGLIKDIVSHPHDTAQEIGYAVEKKVGQYTKQRSEFERKNAEEKVKPQRWENDKKLNEGKISREMHEIRAKQLDEKVEKMSTPIEQKVGGAVKREANSAFGIINEVMTSPEKRKELKKAGVTSAFEGNTIAATFARGVASTTKQLQEKPAKHQPMIFSGATVAPSRKEFGGKGTRKTSPTKGTVVSKGKAPGVNFGGGAFGSPIAFNAAAGRFSLFGGGQPAPAPAPKKGKGKR
jgi:hypothetical protein